METPSVAPNPAAPAGAAQQAKSAEYSNNVSHGEVNSSTPIKSLSDLKNKAPKVYNQMLLSVMLLILHDMKEHQDRFKQIIKEGDRAASGA